jgi:hypothetical protein
MNCSLQLKIDPLAEGHTLLHHIQNRLPEKKTLDFPHPVGIPRRGTAQLPEQQELRLRIRWEDILQLHLGLVVAYCCWSVDGGFCFVDN